MKIMPILPAVAVGEVETLDTADPEAVAAYERAFYNAFASIRPAELLRQLWIWDDAAGRIAAPISYADQIVYILRDKAGQVRRAMAVNLTQREVQAERFGFVLPPAPDIAEMLAFFTDGPHDLQGGLEFCRACYAALCRRGLRCGYGTARRRPLAAYGRFGTEVVEERWLEGEARYLLRFDFAQLTSRPSQSGFGRPAHGQSEQGQVAG